MRRTDSATFSCSNTSLDWSLSLSDIRHFQSCNLSPFFGNWVRVRGGERGEREKEGLKEPRRSKEVTCAESARAILTCVGGHGAVRHYGVGPSSFGMKLASVSDKCRCCFSFRPRYSMHSTYCTLVLWPISDQLRTSDIRRDTWTLTEVDSQLRLVLSTRTRTVLGTARVSDLDICLYVSGRC